ncbi:MAG TPA: methylated-DNA--[protein]-cysteine S-methyltransferase [Phycisphaerales bacterium]|nr:methylated-DNA--[protein]-cysteine S-methyltransferase [Phycisphaerales bacterium]
MSRTGTSSAARTHTDASRWRAYSQRDPQADGAFVVCVKSTGIFCRPICPARQALRSNIEFADSCKDALLRGYRPCKRCKPMDTQRRGPLVSKLLSLIERIPSQPVRARHLSAMGIDPLAARKQFQAALGMTFAAYQRSRRVGLVVRNMQSAITSSKRGHVTHAQQQAGFTSSSGFRDAVHRLTGKPPSQAHTARVIASLSFTTPLGDMLALADDTGLLVVDFTDRKGMEREIARLRIKQASKSAPAAIVPDAAHPVLTETRDQLLEYFAGTRTHFTVPLAPHMGTPFQERVWTILRDIPRGSTRSYAQQAKAVGDVKAVRAVALANGKNYRAIIIPCHRVIGSDGTMTGYGGGVERKRWLLRHEGVLL